jgi:hypothetical protein
VVACTSVGRGEELQNLEVPNPCFGRELSRQIRAWSTHLLKPLVSVLVVLLGRLDSALKDALNEVRKVEVVPRTLPQKASLEALEVQILVVQPLRQSLPEVAPTEVQLALPISIGNIQVARGRVAVVGTVATGTRVGGGAVVYRVLGTFGSWDGYKKE